MSVRRPLARWLACLALAIAATGAGHAQSLDFHAPAAAGDPGAPAAMRDLAERLLPVYQDSDPDRYLANLAVLQLSAGDYVAAAESRASLRDRRRQAESGRPVSRGRVLDIYARARSIETQSHEAFRDALGHAYEKEFAGLGDHDAFLLSGWLASAPGGARQELQRLLDEQRSRDIIDEAQAQALLAAYVYYEAYRDMGPYVAALNAADDAHRYVEEDALAIGIAHRGVLTAQVIRPRSAKTALAALLELGIDRPTTVAKESAAHGYAGVWVDLRKGRGAAPFVPYQHDGTVARAVIDWIARQRWSDGRVAMYGEGYSGFTAWAAAARGAAHLKAIAAADPSAPGIDAPMSGNIFQNSGYRWSLEMSRPRAAAAAGLEDPVPWQTLDETWYRSGRRYRDFGRIAGTPNPIFIRWLNHPSYDRYWQSMIPFRAGFARLDIPVLTITGYFSAAEPAALYYFSEHHRYNPHADHSLLIGPYEEGALQRGPAASIRGYDVDAAALIDLRELRYGWLDHALKGEAQPQALGGPVTFEVMGANEWRHSSDLDAMAGDTLRFYLSAGASDAIAGRRLIRRKNSRSATINQAVNLTDRSDAAWQPAADLTTRSLVTHDSLSFVSAPLTHPTEFNGRLRGMLDFVVNKMDMDVNIAAYELTAGGDYLRLFNPTAELRLSYAADRVRRHLLRAGERQTLRFVCERLTSRRLQAGSRLLIVLRVAKRPDREINYGTGNDVSDESIDDGKAPIKVRWFNDSYIEVPARGVAAPPGQPPR